MPAAAAIPAISAIGSTDPMTFEPWRVTMSRVFGRIASRIAAGSRVPSGRHGTTVRSIVSDSRWRSGRMTELCSMLLVIA